MSTKPVDISAFEDDAIRMKASWKKMHNFAATFARDFRRLRDEFPQNLPPDKYGVPWDFGRWMLLRVGPSEKTALRLLELLDRSASTEDRERDREHLQEVRAQQKAEAERRKAEEHAARLARANERQEKKAETQSPKERKEEEKKQREMKAKIKAAEIKIKASRSLPPAPKPSAKANGANGTETLAAKGHAAEKKIAQGKELWIVGVMELAMVMAQVRDHYPDKVAFGDWLITNGFDYDHHNRAALIAMGRITPKLLRLLLETANRHSFGKIWLDFQKDDRLPPETRTQH